MTMDEKGADTLEEDPPKGACKEAPPTPLLPPCRVCGEKASGFHYGVNSCSPCKGFFRRSIVKIQQKREQYKCKGASTFCPLKPGKPSPCPSCRYKKCLGVGMSQEGIVTGRYTYKKRTRDTEEVKQLLNKPENQIEADIEIPEAEAKALIKTLVEAQSNTSALLLKMCSGNDDDCCNPSNQHNTSEEYKAEYLEQSCSTQKNLLFEGEPFGECITQFEKSVRGMLDIIQLVPGFKELSIEDQTTLVKAGHFEFMLLLYYQMLTVDLASFKSCINTPEDFRSFLDSEYIDEVVHFAKSLQALELTDEEVVLTRCIAVTFRDRCPLREAEIVEQIQWKLLNCLRWVAKKNKMNPEERIRRILDRLTALRNITEQSYKVQTLQAMEANTVLLKIMSMCPYKEPSALLKTPDSDRV